MLKTMLKLVFVPGLLGVIAYMSQVGPDGAVSNVSKWIAKLTPPPDWAKAPQIDTVWTVSFAVFAVLAFARYLSAMVRRPLSAPARRATTAVAQPFNVAEWTNQPNYFVWAAACLWADQQPVSKIDARHPAYPTLQMIEGYLEDGTIKSIDGGMTMNARVATTELLKVAELRNERPKFLYPHDAVRRQELISLPDAAQIAYDELDGTDWRLAADNWHSKPEERLDFMATYISYNVPISGCSPPGKVRKQIPQDEFRSGAFLGGGRAFRRQSDNFDTYTDMVVREEDLRDALEKMKTSS